MSRFGNRLAMRARIMLLVGVQSALRMNEGAGELAARAVFARYGSETGLELVDTLLAIGAESAPQPPDTRSNGNGNGFHDPERARELITGAIRADGDGSDPERAAPARAARGE